MLLRRRNIKKMKIITDKEKCIDPNLVKGVYKGLFEINNDINIYIKNIF